MAEAPSDSGAAIRDGYDRWSAVYDHDGNPLVALEEPVMYRAFGDVRGLDVVELGCGTGRHTTWLAQSGASVMAIDFSEGMLAEARRKLGPATTARLIAHDLQTPLPFDDASFDLAVSGLVLEHLRDLTSVFREARRVLRRDGRAVISAMHPAMMLRGAQARFTDPTTGSVVQPGSFPHQISDFVMASLRGGFTIDDIREIAPDAALAARVPRAEKYVAWPMLVVLQLRVAA